MQANWTFNNPLIKQTSQRSPKIPIKELKTILTNFLFFQKKDHLKIYNKKQHSIKNNNNDTEYKMAEYYNSFSVFFYVFNMYF